MYQVHVVQKKRNGIVARFKQPALLRGGDVAVVEDHKFKTKREYCDRMFIHTMPRADAVLLMQDAEHAFTGYPGCVMTLVRIVRER